MTPAGEERTRLDHFFPELLVLEERIAAELGTLAPTDPFLLSHSPDHLNGEEGPVHAIVSRISSQAMPRTRSRLHAEYFAAGPLDDLLADPEITEIIINGPDSIWYEKLGVLHRHHDRFLSALNYRNFIVRLCRESSMQTSLDYPFADGEWRDTRVHLITPPASGDEAVLTLRKHPSNPWTFERLAATGWANADALRILREMVLQRRNFLIVGCTGSGKTSVLNACLGEINQNERAVLIEDTQELRKPNGASVNLLTRRDAHGHLREIDQCELLRQALRMRPDRIIMGEIRGGEAKDLLMAFATGHSGCIGTLHADSARQALIRLEMLIQLGAPQWSLQAVRTLILLSIQFIVVVGRKKNGGRCLEGIHRLSSLEEVGFLIEKAV